MNKTYQLKFCTFLLLLFSFGFQSIDAQTTISLRANEMGRILKGSGQLVQKLPIRVETILMNNIL